MRTIPRIFLPVIACVLVGVSDPAAQMPMQHSASGSKLPHDVPDFTATPTNQATGNGPWSEARIWSAGHVPSVDEVVRIPAGIRVTYDVADGPMLHAVGIDGTLSFRTSGDTRLVTGIVEVMPSGTLEIGTVDAPIDGRSHAEIVIADQSIDTVADPEQYGTGLIGFGKIRMHGAIVQPTFARVASEPSAGQRSVTLEVQPTAGWQSSRLIIPGTRQSSTARPEWEELSADNVTGPRVDLKTPLAFDHSGARDLDGRLDFLPHVGNLTRNVIVRSANPSGTRGHVMFVAQADVDIRYALFKDLGRTTADRLDLTVVDHGRATHIGKNQIGRYALHMHHVFGPSNAPSNRRQFTLIGNAIDGGKKWGIVVHDSHYGLIQDNVVYNVRGAGIVTEDGSESGNVFDHNFVVRAEGTRTDDIAMRAPADWGWEGTGFWFRGPDNEVQNNVAADTTSFAFTYMMFGVEQVPAPTAPGVDPMKRSRPTNMNMVPLRKFANNEAYKGMGGLTIWNLGAACCTATYEVAASTVQNFRAWAIDWRGFDGHASNRLILDGWIQRGDPRALREEGNRVLGVSFEDYLARYTVIRNADIQGVRTGILLPEKVGDTRDIYGSKPGTVLVENSRLRNTVNIQASMMRATTGGGNFLVPRRVVIRDVLFGGVEAASARSDIVMTYAQRDDPNPNPIVKDEVFVYGYNRTPGDDFQLFYKEQASSFVVPPTGLPNSESWSQKKVAIAGSVAPCTTERARLVGFSCPVSGPQPIVWSGGAPSGDPPPSR